MAPVKFGDLAKTATEVLDDDYQTSGYQLKVKTGTNFRGANATTAVDLWPGGDTKTCSKVTWKFPKPVPALPGLSVDKLEMNKKGEYAAELSFSEALHKVKGLSVVAKSDLVEKSKASVSATYNATSDIRIALETKPLGPVGDGNVEITYAFQQFVLGAKMTKKDKIPALGCRFASGPLFAALTATDGFKKFKAHTMFKANDDLKLAGVVEHGLDGKDKPKFSVGCFYNLAAFNTKLKLKASHDMTVSFSKKVAIAKGFNYLGGLKYDINKKSTSFGMQISID